MRIRRKPTSRLPIFVSGFFTFLVAVSQGYFISRRIVSHLLQLPSGGNTLFYRVDSPSTFLSGRHSAKRFRIGLGRVTKYFKLTYTEKGGIFWITDFTLLVHYLVLLNFQSRSYSNLGFDLLFVISHILDF